MKSKLFYLIFFNLILISAVGATTIGQMDVRSGVVVYAPSFFEDTNATTECAGAEILLGNGTCSAGAFLGGGGVEVDPVWTTNWTAFNTSWGSTFNASYYLVSNPDGFFNVTNPSPDTNLTEADIHGFINDNYVNVTGDTMTGPLNISAFNTGNVLSSAIEAYFGNPFGAIEIGATQLFQSNLTIAGMNLNGSFVIRNTESDSNIEFIFATTNNLVRFAIPTEGSQLATYNPRSFLVGGDLGQAFDDGIINCTAQGYENIDCDTGTTGADLGIQDDLEVRGSVYVNESINVTQNITASYFFGNGSQLTGIFSGTETDPVWEANWTAHNDSWGSTFNSTYDTWAYNQTTPAVAMCVAFNYYNATNPMPNTFNYYNFTNPQIEVDPTWTGNWTAFNDSWGSTFNATYDAFEDTNLSSGGTSTGSINISSANFTVSTGQFVCLSQTCDSWIKYELHNTTIMLNATNNQWIVSNQSGVFIQG